MSPNVRSRWSLASPPQFVETLALFGLSLVPAHNAGANDRQMIRALKVKP